MKSNLLKINLQLFGDGDPTLDDLIGLLGNQPQADPPADPPQDPPPEDPQDPPQDPPADPIDPPADPQDPPGDPEPPPQDDKSAKAFAQMRVQNKQMEQTLKGLAAVLKIDTTDPTAMQAKINDLLIENEAKKQGIDPDFYRRITNIEAENAQFKQKEMHNNAIRGFQQVMTDFGLTEKELNAFGVQLTQAGINPFEQEVNLTQQYRLLNFDTIVQRKIDAAVKAEQERAANATNHSTNPGQKQGAGEGAAPEKVNTVQQLNEYFNSFQAK